MKIDVLRFQYRGISPAADELFDAMCAATAKEHDIRIKKYGNALIHLARNRALVQVRSDADAVLFVDDDMAPQPSAVLRMIAHEQPVVSALCTTRSFPVEIAAKIYDKPNDCYRPLAYVKQDRLLIGEIAVGAAFLLMDKATVNALVEHYLTARDWLEDNRPAFDRMRVRPEMREAERRRKEELRRELYATQSIVRVFDVPTIGNETQLGEDVCLSRRLIQIGVPVALDSNVIVGHMGEYAYGPWDVDLEKERDVA